MRQAGHPGDTACRIERPTEGDLLQGGADGEKPGQPTNVAQERQEVGLRQLGGIGTGQADWQIGTQRDGTAFRLLRQPGQKSGGIANRPWCGQSPANGGLPGNSDPTLARIDAPVRMGREFRTRAADARDPAGG
jgi:hypothetical protein